MAKFKVEYPDGKVLIEERSDCKTVEQYINSAYGRNAKPTAKISLAVAPKPAVKK